MRDFDAAVHGPSNGRISPPIKCSVHSQRLAARGFHEWLFADRAACLGAALGCAENKTLGVVALLIAAAMPAKATLYSWSWDGIGLDGSGYLTTGPTEMAPFDLLGIPAFTEFEKITDITGSFAGPLNTISSIHWMSSSTPGVPPGAANLLFPNHPALLNFGGLVFGHVFRMSTLHRQVKTILSLQSVHAMATHCSAFHRRHRLATK